MSSETLQTLITEDPFLGFTMKLVDGNAVTVTSASVVAIMADGTTLGCKVLQKDPEMYIDINLIVSIHR